MTIDIMFTNNVAVQGLEADNFWEDDGWVEIETKEEKLYVNKDNIAYMSVRGENER